MAGNKAIKLTNTDELCLIDEDDYDKVVSYGNWHKSDTGYAVRRYKGSTLRMHRLIANPGYRLFVDHINRNKLDNRRINLRAVNQAENANNGSGNFKHTVYDKLPKHVSYDKSRGKYTAKRVIQRRFDTLDEAVEFTKNNGEIL